MKRILASLVVLTLILSTLPMTIASATEVTVESAIGNLIDNGSFEDCEEGVRPTGWNVSGFTGTVEEITDGKNGSVKAVEAIVGEDNSGTMYKVITVQKNAIYEASAWVKATEDNATVSLIANTGDKYPVTIDSKTISPGDGWVELKGVFTRYVGSYKNGDTSSNTDSTVRIVFACDKDCYVDEVAVKLSDSILLEEKGCYTCIYNFVKCDSRKLGSAGACSHKFTGNKGRSGF